MKDKNIYDSIRKILGDKPGNLNILQEKIDIDLQIEYFDFSKKIKQSLNPEFILQHKDDIFNKELHETVRKTRFTELASIDNVVAYRTIEKYVNKKEPALRQWAVLALQESRMVLESKLLDENQVFISTGLGGKGAGLRYFVVLILKSKNNFTPLHRKVIKNEFEIVTRKYNAEIEQLNFLNHFATLMMIIPLVVHVRKMISEAIHECNQYGSFLRANFIVTNVRELSVNEINEYLKKSR